MNSRKWWASAGVIVLAVLCGCSARPGHPFSGVPAIWTIDVLRPGSKYYFTRSLPGYGYHQGQWRQWPGVCSGASPTWVETLAPEPHPFAPGGGDLDRTLSPIPDALQSESIPEAPPAPPVEEQPIIQGPDFEIIPTPAEEAPKPAPPSDKPKPAEPQKQPAPEPPPKQAPAAEQGVREAGLHWRPPRL